MGIQASLVFHYTGIDIVDVPIDKAARYIAMNRQAMLSLKLMEEKLPNNGVNGTP